MEALVLLANLSIKEAIGTSLLIIAFNSASGFLGYLTQVNLNWYLMLSLTVAAGFGSILGAYLTKFIDGKQLQKGFGYFVLAVAVFILIKVLKSPLAWSLVDCKITIAPQNSIFVLKKIAAGKILLLLKKS